MGSRTQGPWGSSSGLENFKSTCGSLNSVFLDSRNVLSAAKKVVWLVEIEISASLDTDLRLFQMTSATKFSRPHVCSRTPRSTAYSPSSVLTKMPARREASLREAAKRSFIIDSHELCR